jgi:hypothetical protein
MLKAPLFAAFSASERHWARLREAAEPNQPFHHQLLTIVVVIIAIVVMAALPIVPAVFAPNVMTVDPMLTVLGPVARDPNHFIVAFPVTWAMAVIRPVANFDPDFLRRKGGRENNARGRYRGE